MTNCVSLPSRVRKQLSIAAWGATLLCAVVLLFAAHEMAEHKNTKTVDTVAAAMGSRYTANDAR